MSGKIRKPGLIAILSSPSGTGKTSICRGLLKRHTDYRFSISVTTRPRRGKERDAVDYHFVSDEKFNSMVRKKEFAEWKHVFGYRYGTPYTEITRALTGCRVLLCDVDVQGGMSLKGNHKDAVAIFIIPPSLDELRLRLRKRRTDSAEQMKLRLNKAVAEIGYWKKYDYVVINDTLKDAVEEVDRIISAERFKTIRRNARKYWNTSQARLLGL